MKSATRLNRIEIDKRPVTEAQSTNSAPETGHSKLIINPTKSLAWPFAEKILRLFLGTALTLLIARQIGPEEFGTFSTVFAGYMIFGALAGLGLKDVVIDEISSARTAPRIVLSTASAIVFAASLVLSLAFVVLIKLIYPGYGTEFRVAFILSAILLLKGLEVLLWGLEAHGDLRSIALSQQISIIASAIGKIAILLIGATVSYFAAVTTFEFFVLFAAAVLFASQRGLTPSVEAFRREYAGVLLKRSWPLAASALAVIGYFYVDQIIIALLMDVESVGIYAAASRISQQLYMLPTVLVAAYYPRLTSIYAQSPQKFDEGFKMLSVVLITLAIILSGATLLLSDQVLGLILGSPFDETAPILKLHVLGLIFVSLNVISGRWYVMKGLQRLTLVRQILTAVLNVILNLLLIPFFGLEGAAYATLLSLLFLAFGFDLFSVRTQKLHALKTEAIRRVFSFRAIKSSFAGLRTL